MESQISHPVSWALVPAPGGCRVPASLQTIPCALKGPDRRLCHLLQGKRRTHKSGGAHKSLSLSSNQGPLVPLLALSLLCARVILQKTGGGNHGRFDILEKGNRRTCESPGHVFSSSVPRVHLEEDKASKGLFSCLHREFARTWSHLAHCLF